MVIFVHAQQLLFFQQFVGLKLIFLLFELLELVFK